MEFITENFLLILCLIVSGTLLAFPKLGKGKNAPLTPTEVVKKANEGAQLVDLRPHDAFVTGTIAGAVNIPAKEVDARLSTLQKDKTTILVCQNGRDSQQCLKKFRSNGFKDCSILQGGIVSWQAAKLPLTGISALGKKSGKKKKQH